jgi:two-component system nitrate/nitrite response regulator NarL
MSQSQSNILRVQIISPHVLIAAALATLVGDESGRFEVPLPVANCDHITDDALHSTIDICLIDLVDIQGIECVRRAVKDYKMRVLVITGLTETAFIDAAIAAGAMGIVRKTEQPDTLFKALECVAGGELWLDRISTGRIFTELARRSISEISATGTENAEISVINRLTRKELLVASVVGKNPGATGQQLAELLHISESTLRNHLSTIYNKLDLSNRMELYAFVNSHGINVLPARKTSSRFKDR